MYSASCPNCGAAMVATSGGSVLARCSQCPWMGQATFHYLPRGSQNGGSGPNLQHNIFFQTLSNGGMLTTAPAMPDDPPAEPDPLDVRRDALRQRLADAVDAVNDEMFGLDVTDWQMPAWRLYERLQEAHAALYEALGGVRMGDYRPDPHLVSTALVALLLGELLVLDGAWQVGKGA